MLSPRPQRVAKAQPLIGGLVGAGGGTLHGLNEDKQHAEHYRKAYPASLRSRGYTR